MIYFRRLEASTGDEEYLLDYDFIDARNNPKQRVFYEKLQQLYPKQNRKQENMSLLAVPTEEKALRIFHLLVECGANVTLRIAKTLKKHKAED